MKRRLGWAIVLACVAAWPLRAEPVANEKDKATDDDLRIKGVFETALPRTERKNSLRLIVHPHLGDFTERDHLRTELGLRYGITQRWEATVEGDSYFTHGLKKGTVFSDAGIAGIHLGTKYLLRKSLLPGWETAVGLDWSKPLGTPPVDVTDGLRHISQYATFSRQLVEHPAWRVFFGGIYEDVSPTGIPGTLNKNQLDADNVGVTTGFVYTHKMLTYSLEMSYNTEHPTEDIGKDIITVRPGVVWTVPDRFKFGAKGRWLLGLSLRMSHGNDGYDFGAGAKLRVNFDFKRLLGRKKESASRP